MATRIESMDQQHQAANQGGVKQKNAQRERRGRTALGDIGNLAAAAVPTVQGKPLTQINRPITRSFGAQLLANARAAGEKEKKQGDQVADLGLGVKKEQMGAVIVTMPVVARKKLQPEPNNKPIKAEAAKPAPDCRCVKNEVKKEEEEGPKKRKGPSFTSVLAARSKEAIGAPKKLEELIVDIDEGDAGNELAVVEYVDEMHQFYKLTEGESRVHDYMGMQPDVDERMRSILVDWLIEVHYKFELRPETLYLTINIVDRFLSMKMVPRKELQLVGMSSLLIASKYEEIWGTEVNDLVCISDRAYTNAQVLAMEKAILGKLAWQLTVPTPFVFLPRYIKASTTAADDIEVENMAYFFAEIGLMNYSTIVSFCPSVLAASSVYAARCTLNKIPCWTETLKHYTGYAENQLMDCSKILVKLHSLAPESKLRAVYKKFSKSDFQSVALRCPAKSLLA